MNQTKNILLIAYVLLTAACSADDEPSDGATPDDLGGGDLAVSFKYVGSIDAREDRFVAGGHSFVVSAAFVTGQTFCASHETAGCQVSTCPTQGSSTGTAHSVGTIMVTGGASPVVLTPQANGTYVPHQDSMRSLWTGGQTLTFTASGAEVPAFSLTVVGPDSVTFTSPAPTKIDRSRDQTFTWRPVANGEVEITIWSSDPGGSSVTAASCSFPASAGTATIAGAVLGQLSPDAQGGVTILARSDQSTVVGDWLLAVYMTDPPATSDGKVFAVRAALQ